MLLEDAGSTGSSDFTQENDHASLDLRYRTRSVLRMAGLAGIAGEQHMVGLYCFIAYAVAVLVLLPILACLYRQRHPPELTAEQRAILQQLTEDQPQ